MITRRHMLAATGGFAALAAADPAGADAPTLTTKTKGWSDGDQTKRFTAVRQGAG